MRSPCFDLVPVALQLFYLLLEVSLILLLLVEGGLRSVHLLQHDARLTRVPLLGVATQASAVFPLTRKMRSAPPPKMIG